MTATKQHPEVKKAWSDDEAANHARSAVIYVHAPWVSSTITGILGLYYTSMEKPNLTGIMILPIFIYFNAIHFAKSYLNYNKTMIVASMSLFPTMVIVVNVVPLYNPDVIGNFMGFYCFCFGFCAIFGMVCVELRLKELQERLWADEKLKQLINHEQMFTIWCALSLAMATYAAMFVGYINTTLFIRLFCFVPHDVIDSPSTDLNIYVSVVVSVSGFLALFFGKMSVCHYLKLRKLKAAKTVVKNSEISV